MLTFDTLPDKVKDNYKRNITSSVAFVKADGTVRHIAFRRNLNSYIASDKPKSEKQVNVQANNNLLLVVDTNAYIKALKGSNGDKAAAAKKYIGADIAAPRRALELIALSRTASRDEGPNRSAGTAARRIASIATEPSCHHDLPVRPWLAATRMSGVCFATKSAIPNAGAPPWISTLLIATPSSD